MARSEQLRNEIARLQKTAADHRTKIAAADQKATGARAKAAKAWEKVSKATNDSSRRMAISAAEREDKAAASAAADSAKAAASLANVEKNIATKRTSLASALRSEERNAENARKRADAKRRSEEKAHAREIGRLSQLAPIRYIQIRPPEPSKLRVLYLTANPDAIEETPHPTRRQHRGIRRVAARRPGSARRQTAAPRFQVLRPRRTRTQAHFSGHAHSGGIILEAGDDQNEHDFPFDQLARLLGATTDPPQLVVLNACESLDGADDLLQTVPVVIGMADTIDDAAAIVFASYFYGAIAAAQSVQAALDQAKIAIEQISLGDATLPTIRTPDDVDPSTLVLVTPP
jgi:hypothetical protein